jgi:hypothetical protein
MMSEPTDKLDAAANIVVNGPADDTVPDELIVRRQLAGPSGPA